ncbi:MAG: hypothetical protein BWY11_00271 [Firmicutes bacterium ADurb.Bin182]|nr:MAG: hypothetical protein BWY11_00271 [Firmicutes bacterium ADurb.Bin182]
MFVENYYSIVTSVLKDIFTKEADKIREAGSMLADTLQKGGLLHVFGCGHSHMFAEELFYRAGGLAAVSPIFEVPAMLHEGAVKSSEIERTSGYAHRVVSRCRFEENDCFLIVSTSGINPFGIEMAQEIGSKGVKTIGISSFAYLKDPSRHKDGLHLPDVCDLCIDNHVPHGDAAVPVNSDGTKAGPVSTIASAAICNGIVLSACEQLKERGIEPELFRSGNLPGGENINKDLINRYRLRVKHL